MAKMLDLTVLQEQTLEIKMLDGTTLRLNKPTQKLLLQFVSLEKKVADTEIETQIEAVKDLAVAILNNNTSGKRFDELEESYDFAIQQAIITAYGQFIAEIMNQKN